MKFWIDALFWFGCWLAVFNGVFLAAGLGDGGQWAEAALGAGCAAVAMVLRARGAA